MIEGTLTTQFAYNGDGVRASKTVDSATTEYVVDLATTLPVVITDTDAIYLYGLDVIAEQLALRQGSGQAQRYYYVHDGLGSVRQLLDNTGQIGESYAYDPFGVPLAGDTVPNPWRFTGEAWDAEVELLYLRARYYQPGTGRFMTKDPWRGDVLRPGTLNGYVYVANNAVNWVDPTGLQGPTPTSTRGPSHPAGPEPSVAPTPRPQPGSTPTPWDIQTPVVQELARLYGIEARRVYAYYGALDWHHTQLDLVREAASDFADLMQGKAAGFKARLGPVPLHRSGEGTDVWGARGRTYGSHITLTGVRSDWADERRMKWVIVHELAHWWDQENGGRLSHEMFAAGMWTEVGCRTPAEPGPPPTFRVRDWNLGRRDRPNMNPGEDWADSVATYVYWQYAGRVGWQISWSRWSVVGNKMDPGKWQDYHDYPDEWGDGPFGRALVRWGRFVN